jgi:hypothetical protein
MEAQPRPDRIARPPRPGAGGWGVSGPARRAMNRRGADLCARTDRPWAARARVMTQASAVRVLGRGGGDVTGRGSAIRQRCLTQGCELDGRSCGLAHQLAERACLLATCGHRGEHVFVKLRPSSDGTPLRPAFLVTIRAHLALERAFAAHDPATHLAEPGERVLRASAKRATGAGERVLRAPAKRATGAGERVLRASAKRATRVSQAPRGGRPATGRPAQRCPRESQMSTLVRTLSITASVNSVVVAWPPRSIVLTPPAVVSSTLS